MHSFVIGLRNLNRPMCWLFSIVFTVLLKNWVLSRLMSINWQLRLTYTDNTVPPIKNIIGIIIEHPSFFLLVMLPNYNYYLRGNELYVVSSLETVHSLRLDAYHTVASVIIVKDRTLIRSNFNAGVSELFKETPSICICRQWWSSSCSSFCKTFSTCRIERWTSIYPRSCVLDRFVFLWIFTSPHSNMCMWDLR